MAVTASGDLSLRWDACRKLVASSASFRTWVGAADAAAALARIHAGYAADSATRPMAVVWMTGAGKWVLHAQGQTQLDAQGVEMAVAFIGAVSSQAAIADQVYEYCNVVGAVLAEMMANSGVGTYLRAVSVQAIEPPQMSSPGEGDDPSAPYLFSVWGFNCG